MFRGTGEESEEGLDGQILGVPAILVVVSIALGLDLASCPFGVVGVIGVRRDSGLPREASEAEGCPVFFLTLMTDSLMYDHRVFA